MGIAIETPAARPTTYERSAARWIPAAGALGLWLGLVWLTHVWGERLVHRDPAARIFAAPLAGRFDPRLGWRTVPALAVAAAAVAFGPRVAKAWPWRRLLFVGSLLAAGWALALAFVDGLHAWVAPLVTRWDYLVDLPKLAGVHEFLRGFSSNLGLFSTHVRAHPPAMLLMLKGLAAAGLRGPVPEAVLVIAGGASIVPAVMVVMRELTGESLARRAWPFLAVAPFALWIATSADALFAGVAAWGGALVVLATGRAGGRRDVLAATGGLLLGVAAFLSYGLVLAWLIPVAVAARRGTARPLMVALAATGAVVAAFASAGFWWPSGLTAARVEYLHSAARARPQHYFWVGNLGVLALMVGPAVAVAAMRVRDRGLWFLAAAALAMVAFADASGMSKGEVERIWLPFAPWLLVLTSGFVQTRAVRTWLGLQAALAVAIQLAVRSPW